MAWKRQWTKPYGKSLNENGQYWNFQYYSWTILYNAEGYWAKLIKTSSITSKLGINVLLNSFQETLFYFLRYWSNATFFRSLYIFKSFEKFYQQYQFEILFRFVWISRNSIFLVPEAKSLRLNLSLMHPFHIQAYWISLEKYSGCRFLQTSLKKLSIEIPAGCTLSFT